MRATSAGCQAGSIACKTIIIQKEDPIPRVPMINTHLVRMGRADLDKRPNVTNQAPTAAERMNGEKMVGEHDITAGNSSLPFSRQYAKVALTPVESSAKAVRAIIIMPATRVALCTKQPSYERRIHILLPDF
jgi:hypothetical protein